jgi:amino acid transporter
VNQAEFELQSGTHGEGHHLRRVLTLADLIFYGMILISPLGPVPLFGTAQQLSNGHAVTAMLVAGIAMTLTAFSYGRMAALFPSAGSAYTFVGRGLNDHLGFMAGWAMSMQYLLVPMLCIIQATLAIERLFPKVPYAVWAAFFAGLITFLNLRGIRTAARTNKLLVWIMFVVVGAFMVLGLRYLLRFQGWSGLISVKPFYDPLTFHPGDIMTASSFVALSYFGFEGVTTLAEDAQNPRRNVFLGTVLACLFTGVLSCLEVYLAQQVWPSYKSYPRLETGFMDVTRLVGGSVLFQATGAVVILGMLGCALSGQAAAARLLFGMGRESVLPRKIFAYLDPVKANPTCNIVVVGLLAFVGSILFGLEHAAEVLNFGALLAFMGVNLAALRQYYFSRRLRAQRRLFRDALVPALGFSSCLVILLSLPRLAKLVGGAWFLTGVAYDAVNTRGFRSRPVAIDFGD